MSAIPAVRVLLLDPDPLAADSVREQLEHDEAIVLVGAVGTGREAVECVVSQRPHVLLIDLKNIGAEGLVASRRARTIDSNIGIALLSIAPSDELVLLALSAGAVATVDKLDGTEQLGEVLRTVAGGGVAIPPSVTRRFVRGLWPPRQGGVADPDAHLTEREWRVLEFVCDGCLVADAARRLGMTRGAIERHLCEVERKLSYCGLLGARTPGRVPAPERFRPSSPATLVDLP